MNDHEREHIDVLVTGPTVVEVDAERIAAIIFAACHTSEQSAVRASNLILDYLTEAHRAASRPQ